MRTMEPAKQLPVAAECDVVVAGGGPGGFMAALGAARAGAKTVLVERLGCLFGMATSGLMTSFNGFRNEHKPDHLQTVRGYAQELVDRLLDKGGACACTAHGHFGELRKGECPYAVSFDPEILKAVALEMLTEAGVNVMFHTLFADALTDGRNVIAAVVESKSGREAVVGRIYVDANGDGDLAARAGARFGTMADADQRAMSATLMYRVVGMPKPSEEERRLWMNGVTTRWGPTVHGCDCSDGAELTSAEISVRREMEEHLGKLREEYPDVTLVETAAIIGVRETRRIVGRYVISEDDALTGRPLQDSVAVCSNPMPSYNGSRYFFDHLGFEIPYLSLVPADLDNVLLAGRCISASQPAFQSARSMAPNMAISQASGAAAAMCASGGCSPADVDTTVLIARLKAEGAVVQIPDEERRA